MTFRSFDEIIKQLEGNEQMSRVVVAAANDDHTLSLKRIK